MSEIEAESRAAWDAYLTTRRRILAGEIPWVTLAEHFTDDAVYIDPAWGRVEGIEAVREFLTESMGGLEDWTFPEVFTMFDGRRVVTMWEQVIPGADGQTRSQPGLSVLYYGADGKFCYEMDLLNMTHVIEDIGALGWAPGDGFNFPPASPNRDHSLGPVAHYFE